MNRNTESFAINNFKELKVQMLNWANQFNICTFLDNHQYHTKHNSVECLLAVDAIQIINASKNSLHQLKDFCSTQKDWLFGHVGYDFKNYIEPLTSKHPDGIQFSDFFFFQPNTVVELKQNEIIISSVDNNPIEIFEEIKQQPIVNTYYKAPIINFQPKIDKQEYLTIINKLKEHLQRGDCYEINFCQEFFAENIAIDALATYNKLVDISPNPFSCFYKMEDKYLLCASPERYVKKEGTTIISQPIKGTYKRNLLNPITDNANKIALQQSTKDKSENVMVVDLVRNDLSKICKQGSVVVEELFGVYTFPQVHQMISTVKGIVNDDVDFADVLKATFPMGSMTGAPKKRVMELIEQYEQTKRGIYSGCVGYINPQQDFDFNVVIRSLLYNSTNKYLSYQVGGGITFYSNAENEYEECLLKAEAMKKVFE